MTYQITVAPNAISIDMTAPEYAISLQQVGQQGAAGPTGISWRGEWALSTDFALRDAVSNNGSSYICIQAHTSSATDEPGVGANTATYWEVLAAKGVDGSGTGTVTSIDITGGTGITSTGGPVTSSGAITVALDSATQTSLALADSAQQPPAEGAFVDGDKTKLDGIEAGATADQTGAEIKTALFAEADTNNLTDTLLSKLNGIEAGADVTDTANVTAAGALMDSELTSLSGVKTLTVPDSTTISTFGASLVDDADASAARTTLGLGTAATTASTAYATAAQGALADSAVQPGDDADTLGSGAATDGQVLTADGAGGAAWEDVAAGVPAGCILMWSGTIATIPSGWALCDGTGGTPNLTGRFVVHADADTGGTYNPGNTGGADTVTLTTSQIPSHDHSFSGTTNTTGAHTHSEVTYTTFPSGEFATIASGADIRAATAEATTGSSGSHSHTISGTTGATGTGGSHENRPPYYALAYIMKL